MNLLSYILKLFLTFRFNSDNKEWKEFIQHQISELEADEQVQGVGGFFRLPM